MCAEKNMEVPSEGSLGRIGVAESVVALIAFKEAMELDGIVGTSGGLVEDITSFVRKGETPKGVRVTRDEEDRLEIDLSIIVEYGRDVREIASALQVKVMDEVEKMTGNRPKAVNINIVKVYVPQKEKTAPAPEHESESTTDNP
jgi:uncharacterized alkaline shock family protein YloU